MDTFGNLFLWGVNWGRHPDQGTASFCHRNPDIQVYPRCFTAREAKEWLSHYALKSFLKKVQNKASRIWRVLSRPAEFAPGSLDHVHVLLQENADPTEVPSDRLKILSRSAASLLAQVINQGLSLTTKRCSKSQCTFDILFVISPSEYSCDP